MLKPALRQSPPLPSGARPIASIGAGETSETPTGPPTGRRAGESPTSSTLKEPGRGPSGATTGSPGFAPPWSWYPDAFVGPMASLMRFASGESADLPTPVEDAWRTMAVFGACHPSSDSGATPIPK
ncbi:MAG: hypothetical protein ABSH26_02930 [Opitutaceae bacterium]